MKIFHLPSERGTEHGAKPQKTNDTKHWVAYRALRNHCTRMIKNAKSGYYLVLLNQNLNDPKKSTAGEVTPPTLLEFLKINDSEITGKQNIVDAFNSHFINAGVFTQSSISVNIEERAFTTTRDSAHNFSFSTVLASQVHKALSTLDCKKSSGSDQIEPFFVKTAADLIAGPIASIFNLSLCCGSIHSC